jgi:hypothetical protein
MYLPFLQGFCVTLIVVVILFSGMFMYYTIFLIEILYLLIYALVTVLPHLPPGKRWEFDLIWPVNMPQIGGGGIWSKFTDNS